MATTIKDVARLAGVGVGTASRVLSGKGAVAPDTAARVQQAIQTLGFKPSSIGRALSRRSLDIVGLYLPSYNGLFYGPLLQAVDQQLRAAHRHMVLANGCGEQSARQQALDGLQFLQQRECDGLLLLTHDLSDADLLALQPQLPPLAILNRVVPGLEAFCFGSDHEEGGRLAARHLLAMGHRRIALIGGPAFATDNTARLRGFHAELAEAGVKLPPRWVQTGDFEAAGGAQAAQALLAVREARGARPFTAVFCANDAMALGAMGVFHRAGLRVPDDVSVLGYDDDAHAPHLCPALSTVRIDIGAAATAATQDLLHRCYGLALPPAAHDFPPVLVPRASVRALGPAE